MVQWMDGAVESVFCSGCVTISGFGRENATLHTEKRQGFKKLAQYTNWRTNPEKPEHRSQMIEIPGQICGRKSFN
jgi:hypothetical protein